MANELSRTLTLLRKERGLNQKTAAIQLGISQALLSHYEKGIRECGLDFLVKCALYYNVSTDYLLGLSPDKKGAVIEVDQLPDENAAGKENTGRDMMAVLNKKLIFNSLNIIYDLLAKQKSSALTTEISHMLSTQVYKVFRYIYSIDSENPQSFFSLEYAQFSELTSAAHMLSEMKIKALCGKEKSSSTKSLKPKLPMLTSDSLSKAYPLYYSSLANLIQNTETKIKK